MFSLSRFLEQRWAREKERELFSFLKDAHTESVPHYQKSLFVHLANTYATLKSWECEPHVCYAGLFHSIYGTQIFKTQTIPYADRQRIRDLIGEPAECLVYLFSVSDRPCGFIEALRTLELSDAVHGTKILITPTELMNLLFIECANLKDQEGFAQFRTQTLQSIERQCFSSSAIQLQKLSAILSEAHDPSGIGD